MAIRALGPIYLVPPVTVAAAWPVLREVPPPLALAGGLLALIGVALSRAMTTRRAAVVGHNRSVVLAADAVARFAALLADRSRAAICLALLDGRAWTAGELARQAGVARSTTSEHLTVLVEAGLPAEERQGRHRYVRLADASVAQLVEDLAGAVGERERPVSLRTVHAARELGAGRTCYDHLAGELGVAIFDALVSAGLIAVRDGLTLTAAGRAWFVGLAGEDVLHRRGSRPLLRTCLDWTERRPHLGAAPLRPAAGTRVGRANAAPPGRGRHARRRSGAAGPERPGFRVRGWRRELTGSVIDHSGSVS